MSQGSARVVQVMVDSPLPQLDHVFDYLIPDAITDVPVGSRLRVRFAGRLVNGFAVARPDDTEHAGALKPIERVIGPEPVLTEQTLRLVSEVADRYAGTFSDVVRSAVPPRHARAEAVVVEACRWQASPDPDGRQLWSQYDAGPALVERLTSTGGAPIRAAWSAAPASTWPDEVAALVAAVLERPTGAVIIVVPDAADVERVLGRFAEARTAGAVAVLTADQGPERRYREFLRVLRGGARLVIGTRAAVFAPVHDLALIVVWDDGDDALIDPQAPYWHARDVAALRSHQSGCHLVVGSPARSISTQQWCESGWARSVEPSRATLAAVAPRVRAMSEDDAARDEAAAAARLPHQAWRVAREALRTGPVLVQVARRGYVPQLACQDCRQQARCACGGPLERRASTTAPLCTWCGALATGWTCPSCAGTRLRAVAVGAERTAEEIGRAFPGVRVVASHAGHMVARIDPEPAVVIATPGAEPECEGGYRAVLLLDARALLHRPFLDAAEQAVRRWFAAARLAAPGAPVVVTADNAIPAVQALVRWQAPWFAARELGERAAAGLPPAVRMAAVVGHPDDALAVAADLQLPHRTLGPVPLSTATPGRRRAEDAEDQRVLVTVAREHAAELGRQLRRIVSARATGAKGQAVKAKGARVRPVHVRLDPIDV